MTMVEIRLCPTACLLAVGLLPQDTNGLDDQDLSQSLLTPIQEVGLNNYSRVKSQFNADGFL